MIQTDQSRTQVCEKPLDKFFVLLQKICTLRIKSIYHFIEKSAEFPVFDRIDLLSVPLDLLMFCTLDMQADIRNFHRRDLDLKLFLQLFYDLLCKVIICILHKSLLPGCIRVDYFILEDPVDCDRNMDHQTDIGTLCQSHHTGIVHP